MQFNQLIWNTLIWAHRSGNDEAMRALEEYAAEHDGRLFVATGCQGDVSFEFVPNPVGKY
jgi:hypothetical protein